MAYPEIGAMAPEFSTLDQNANSFNITDFKGEYVCLYFYPKAMTPGCITQAVAIKEDIRAFEENNIKVIGISPDEPARLKKFEEKQGLNFTLASDPEHKIAEMYGTWVLKKMYGREYYGFERTTFIIDKEGKILTVIPKVKPKEHIQKVLKAIKEGK
jgi:thioredoxin-dependent peroxiredoxin